MRIRPSVVLALGIGYVLGARAGRDHYDAIMRQVREVRERPEVQSVAGVVSAQAGSLYQKLRGHRDGSAAEDSGQPFSAAPGSHSSNGVGAGRI